MSEEIYTKIGMGIGVPPYLLKDAKFELASRDSKFYCYITAKDGVKYAMTGLQTRRLSGRGGKGTIRFRKWLVEQDSEKWACWKDCDQ